MGVAVGVEVAVGMKSASSGDADGVGVLDGVGDGRGVGGCRMKEVGVISRPTSSSRGVSGNTCAGGASMYKEEGRTTETDCTAAILPLRSRSSHCA